MVTDREKCQHACEAFVAPSAPATHQQLRVTAPQQSKYTISLSLYIKQIYISLSLSIYIYMYIYLYIQYICVYIYIYIYIDR